MSIQMIKGDLIDLDNTLYSYEECHQAGLRSSLKQLHKAHPEVDSELFFEEYKLIQSDLKIKLEKTAASHHRLIYFQSILEKLNIWNSKLCLDLYHSYWNNFLAKMALFDNALLFLKELKSKQIPIVIVTDLVAQIQFEKILKLDIDQYIDFIVTSEEVGIEKPNQVIFKSALKKIQCKANEVVMIGDSFDKDIIGAIELGIQAFWYDPDKKWLGGRELPQYTKISSFKELDAIIK